MSSTDDTREFVSLGMFIIDEFTFVDDKGEPTGQTLPPQVRALSICSIRIYNSQTSLRRSDWRWRYLRRHRRTYMVSYRADTSEPAMRLTRDPLLGFRLQNWA